VTDISRYFNNIREKRDYYLKTTIIFFTLQNALYFRRLCILHSITTFLKICNRFLLELKNYDHC